MSSPAISKDSLGIYLVGARFHEHHRYSRSNYRCGSVICGRAIAISVVSNICGAKTKLKQKAVISSGAALRLLEGLVGADNPLPALVFLAGRNNGINAMRNVMRVIEQ